MSRVDAHHHLWRISVDRHEWLDGPEMTPIRRDLTSGDLRTVAADIDATVLVQVLPDLGETVEFLALARDEPLSAGVVGWVNLTDSPARDVATGELEPWATHLATLARQPNVVATASDVRSASSAKVSGLVTEADRRHWTISDLRPYVATALDLFGPDRLMIGSDWPVCLLAGTYADVLGAANTLLDELSAAERAAILGGTATRVYGLTS